MGSYFNIVRNTIMTDDIVSFEDLIIDILILPNGDHYILDEEELPEPLDQFEEGFVKDVLGSLLGEVDALIEIVKNESGFILSQLH